jgi:hypothetical protein
VAGGEVSAKTTSGCGFLTPFRFYTRGLGLVVLHVVAPQQYSFSFFNDKGNLTIPEFYSKW